MRRDPQDANAVFGLGTVAAARGNRAEAARRFEAALRIDPAHGGAAAGLLALLADEDPQQAEQRLLQALAQRPDARLYFALGNVYAAQANWARARSAYAQALALQAENADYAYNLAIAYDRLAQPAQALRYYRMAVHRTDEAPTGVFDPERVRARIERLANHVGAR